MSPLESGISCRVRIRVLLAAALWAVLLALSRTGHADMVPVNGVLKVAPDTAAGFRWPYYLYVPTRPPEDSSAVTILVEPNNTGLCSDDYALQDSLTLQRANQLRNLCDELGVAALVPVFPRPMEHWKVYTHALDRDALLTDIPELKRLDLQLIAMIDDARQRLGERSIVADDRVLMTGFSASGMFVNRFALLHPRRVKAVACGSPGGWPVAPLAEWQGEPLRYPVGIADLEEITGEPFDSGSFAQLPQFLYLGDQDTNDAVEYEDGFDVQDRDLIYRLFGDTLVSRWPTIETIYRQAAPACRLRLYEGVGHEITPVMWRDIKAFLREHR